MSRNELIAKIEALNEWERLIAEAQQQKPKQSKTA